MEEIKGAIALIGYGLAAIGPGIGIGAQEASRASDAVTLAEDPTRPERAQNQCCRNAKKVMNRGDSLHRCSLS